MATRTDQGQPARGPRKNPGGNPKPSPRGNSDHARAQRRQQMIGAALAGVQNALIARGVDPGLAQRYAQVVLTRPGVTIGKNQIHYQGHSFKPAAFAGTKLADYVTGLAASRENQAAITGDPGYQSDLANLTLQQNLSTAGLEDQRRRAILDFGSPAYAGGDQLLAGQAAANPFSVEALLARSNQQQHEQASAAANRAGTLFGGGQQSGQNEATRVNAGQQADATQQLVDLLAGLSQQRAQAGSIYDTGQQTALQAATQRLMSSGTIHAAHAPTLNVGTYDFYHHPAQPPHHVPRIPPPPPPPGRGSDRRAYPTPRPPVAL